MDVSSKDDGLAGARAQPAAMLPAVVPAFIYLAGWYVLSGLVYGLVGIETKGLSFAQIDSLLTAKPVVKAAPVAQS